MFNLKPSITSKKLYTLIVLSLLPWLYLVGAGILFDFESNMEGFGYLPFFALLLIREKVMPPQKKQPEWTLTLKPFIKNILVVIAAVLLTIVVIAISEWIREAKNSLGIEWLWALFALIIAVFITLDFRRIYSRIGEVA